MQRLEKVSIWKVTCLGRINHFSLRSCFYFLNEHGDWNNWHESIHYDVKKWKHFPRYWPFVRRIHRSPVNFPHKGHWPGALMFSLICTQIKGWVNHGEGGDLRRHRAHYDVTVMQFEYCQLPVISGTYHGIPARSRIDWRLVPVSHCCKNTGTCSVYYHNFGANFLDPSPIPSFPTYCHNLRPIILFCKVENSLISHTTFPICVKAHIEMGEMGVKRPNKNNYRVVAADLLPWSNMK